VLEREALAEQGEEARRAQALLARRGVHAGAPQHLERGDAGAEETRPRQGVRQPLADQCAPEGVGDGLARHQDRPHRKRPRRRQRRDARAHSFVDQRTCTVTWRTGERQRAIRAAT
jgi:hypothetical protein